MSNKYDETSANDPTSGPNLNNEIESAKSKIFPRILLKTVVTNMGGLISKIIKINKSKTNIFLDENFIYII